MRGGTRDYAARRSRIFDLQQPSAAAAEATRGAMRQAGLHHAAGALCFATTAHGAAFGLIMRTVAAEARTREVAGCAAWA